MSTRHCYECDTDHPLTEDYFNPSPKNDPPFEEICKACRQGLTKQRRARKKALTDVVEQMQQIGIDLLSREVLLGSSNIPHSAELLESIMAAFGGVDGFGRVFAAQYWQAEPGKAQRTRMLQTVTALTVKNVEHGGAKKPKNLWTEEELQQELNQRIQVEAQRLRIVHVPAAG